MVLISLREFEKKPEEKDRYEKGDILAKYDSEHLGKLKKMPDINQKLFLQLETMDGKILAEIGDKEVKVRGMGLDEDDGGIEFDRDAKDEEKEESDSEKEIDIDDI
jgi:hypothetical protein